MIDHIPGTDKHNLFRILLKFRRCFTHLLFSITLSVIGDNIGPHTIYRSIYLSRRLKEFPKGMWNEIVIANRKPIIENLEFMVSRFWYNGRPKNIFQNLSYLLHGNGLPQQAVFKKYSWMKYSKLCVLMEHTNCVYLSCSRRYHYIATNIKIIKVKLTNAVQCNDVINILFGTSFGNVSV